MISIDQPSAIPRAWVMVASAWVVGLAALLTWVLRTPGPSLREQLKILQFWSLESCVFLGLAVSTVALQDVPRLLDRRDMLSNGALMARGPRSDRWPAASDKPHLLRRADLSERRAEPGGLETCADV